MTANRQRIIGTRANRQSGLHSPQFKPPGRLAQRADHAERPYAEQDAMPVPEVGTPLSAHAPGELTYFT
jgi:hypothetical protein